MTREVVRNHGRDRLPEDPRRALRRTRRAAHRAGDAARTRARLRPRQGAGRRRRPDRRDGPFGRLPQRRTPFTPGYELAGEVVDFTTADTPAPSWLRPGARVAAALTRMGGYAEYVTLPLWQLVPLPDGLDPHVAAAVPLDQNDREPGGVQAVFDHIGGPALRKGYRVLAPGGVLVSYAASGRPGRIVGDTLRAAARVTLLNLRPGRRTALALVPREIRADHARYRAALTELLALAHAGTTAPQITTAPLTEAVHTDLERRALTGKAVLTTDG
ncbi:zinc-binding dehydrogenase [Streptomyces noursei]|uniref:zinc-binding dehydrogenase n=1 Tax=Streptomyces noursei TaxID=1971 RepID=UPI00362D501A